MLKKYLLFSLVIFLIICHPQTILASSIFVTAPEIGKKAYIEIFDGQTNTKIKRILAYNTDLKSGLNIAVGDVTGNGQEEIITAPKNHWIPEVKIYSQNGKLKKSFLAYTKYFRGGIDVATGDINSDGKDEIILALSTYYHRPTIKVLNYDHPQKPLREINVSSFSQKGLSIASGDIDNDGNDEIISGTLNEPNPQIKIYETNASLKSTLQPFNKNYHNGINVASGDFDGDDIAEISACQSSGQCKIFKYGDSQINKIAKSKNKKQNINPNFANLNTSNANQQLIIASGKKPIAKIYQYNNGISKSKIRFQSKKNFSEIAYIPDNSFNFIFYSDAQNTKNPHTRLLEQIQNEKYDFALYGGDFITHDLAYEWEMFQKLDQNILLKKPKKDLTFSFYPTRGDNETYSSYYYQLFNAYPLNQLYYSFDYKNTHIVSLNSEIDYSIGSNQYNWLTADLNQTDKKWKIVFLHRPPYGNIKDHTDNGYQINMQKSIVPIFEQYNVNLVLSGHFHFYQRTYPIYQNQIDFEKGTTYITVGSAGPNTPNTDWFSASAQRNYTYLKANVKNNKILLQTFDTFHNLKDLTRIP